MNYTLNRCSHLIEAMKRTSRISILLWLTLLMFTSIGCAQKSHKLLPEPRPLGSEHGSFFPSEENGPDKQQTKNQPETIGNLTLHDAISIALKSNPELREQGWAVLADAQRVRQAGLYSNPEFEVEVEEFGGAGETAGFDGAMMTFAISQEIDLAGKFAKESKAAKLERELTGWDYESKRLDIVTEVSAAYYGTLAAQAKMKLAEEQIKVSELTQKTVERFVQNAAASSLEKAKANVEAANGRIELQRAKTALRIAKKRLSTLLGVGNGSIENVAGELESLMPVPSLKELGKHIEQNPDIARWLVEHKLRQSVIDIEKANQFPDLTVRGGVQKGVAEDDTTFVVGIGIPLPIFDRNQGGAAAAKYDSAVAREGNRGTDLKVKAALTEAYQFLAQSKVELELLNKEVLPEARRAYESADRIYKRGKFSLLEVLDAKRTLFEVRAMQIEALTSFHLSRIEIERLIGQSFGSIVTDSNSSN